MTDKKATTIYEALSLAQAEMTRAKADKTNPHFRSTYADLSSVMDACLPALLAHGFAVIQEPGQDETGHWLKTVFFHGPSGESVSNSVPMMMGKQDMQGYGSAMTYARRYGLMALAGIAPHDDDGNAAVEHIQAKPEPKPTPPASDESLALLVEYALALDAFEGSIEVFNAWIYGTCNGAEPGKLSEPAVQRTLKFLKENQDPTKWKPGLKAELDNAKNALIKY